MEKGIIGDSDISNSSALKNTENFKSDFIWTMINFLMKAIRVQVLNLCCFLTVSIHTTGRMVWVPLVDLRVFEHSSSLVFMLTLYPSQVNTVNETWMNWL